jgi:hypothetical protein
MSWVRLDDLFGDHPKIEELTDPAFRLHIRAACYSSRHNLGGLVPRGALDGLARGKKWSSLVDELTSCVIPKKGPLWERRDDGHFQIHDFAQFNFTTVEAGAHQDEIRRKRQEAGRAGGKKSAESRQRCGPSQPTKPSKPEANASKQTRSKPEANPKQTLRSKTKQNEAPIPIPSASNEAVVEATAAANPKQSGEAKVRIHPRWKPSADTLSALEVQMIDAWAIPVLLGRFTAHFSVTQETDTEPGWNQRFAKWASRDWNDPRRRPKQTEANPTGPITEDEL